MVLISYLFNMNNIYKGYYKSRKNVKNRKIVTFFICLLFIFAFFMLYFVFLVTPLIVNTSKAQIKVIATKSMNYAITEAINQNISYDDLVNIITDGYGKINMIQANTVKINNISTMIERITLSHLLEVGRNPIEIPLGAFTGITLLSGLGPPVEIEIFPYGEVGCRFLSQFISAGINQTQHKIYVQVDTFVNVVLPFQSVKVKMSNEVLVCESVIIGEIPDTYLKSNSLNEMTGLLS